ncbi:MAG: IMP dehydrogenase [Candidatus Pacearchaeota archaeon]
MHYHILLTEKCDSECKYCYKKSLNEFDNKLNKKFKFDFSEPENFSVDLKKLKKFIEKDKEAVIIFYGGEPLLEIEIIKKIIENINVPYRIQTNGKNLNKLPFKYLKKIKKILVSIDGNRKRTDYNKGEGTYDKIIKNLNLIKKKGYRGEIIARMTISQEFPDKGKLSNVIYQYIGGLKAGMSYTGSKTIEELREKVQFDRMTESGDIESHPHGVIITREAPNYPG